MSADGCYRLGAAGGDLFTSLGVPVDTCAGLAAPSRIPAWTGVSGATTWPALPAPARWRSTSRAAALHTTGRKGLVALLGCTLPSGHAPGATLPTTR